jgi:LysR family transcriptional regulator, nitrogen assimilation regulatory protein
MKYNDQQMRYFLAVAQAGSLRAAAEQLDMTQPALSKQMTTLEAAMSGALFRRDGRGMELTPLGQQLKLMMQPRYAELDAALDLVRGIKGSRATQVRVASVNTLGLYLMPDLIAMLMATHPALQVNFLAASAPDVVERVGRGHADLGLVYDQAVNTDEFVVHRLHMEVLAGFGHAQLAVEQNYSQSQLQAQRLILPPRPYTLRRVMERELDDQLQIAAESNDILISLDLASRGLGLAILPKQLPQALLAAYPVRRVTLLSDQIKRSVVAITRKTDKISEAVALTLSAVKSKIAQLPV